VSRPGTGGTLTNRMSSRAILAVLFAVLLAALVAPGPAFAQPAEAVGKVTQLNKDALAAIDKREFEKARELLKKALDVCEEAGLDRHPARARTHVHMGIVIIQGFKNHELGRKQFRKALEIDPSITVTRSLSTPDLEEAFAEAKAGGSGGDESSGGSGRAAPSGDGQRAGGGPSLSANGLAYHSLSEVKQGGNIVVTVNVEDSLKFSKIVLAYKPQGERAFLGREMDAVGAGAYSATIPDRATTAASVAYYIEAQDEEGQPVAQRGTEARPLVITFSRPSRTTGARAGAEAVAETREVRRRSAEDDDDEIAGQFFAGLLVGSGIGYASGTGEVNADTKVPGAFSGALLGHVAPEVGYWMSSNLMLSLQGRFQLVTGPTEVLDNGKTYSPIPAALAVFAKASWFFGEGNLRPFISGALGGGQIRHVVTFGNLRNCGATKSETCVDSVVAGPLLAAVGGGVSYKLAPAIALVASTNAQVAAPSFTLNLDLNAGVAFSF
jgi:hypothetical protein